MSYTNTGRARHVHKLYELYFPYSTTTTLTAFISDELPRDEPMTIRCVSAGLSCNNVFQYNNFTGPYLELRMYNGLSTGNVWNSKNETAYILLGWFLVPYGAYRQAGTEQLAPVFLPAVSVEGYVLSSLWTFLIYNPETQGALPVSNLNGVDIQIELKTRGKILLDD